MYYIVGFSVNPKEIQEGKQQEKTKHQIQTYAIEGNKDRPPTWNSSATGLAKKFVWVFPLDAMEKSDQAFWPVWPSWPVGETHFWSCWRRWRHPRWPAWWPSCSASPGPPPWPSAWGWRGSRWPRCTRRPGPRSSAAAAPSSPPASSRSASAVAALLLSWGTSASESYFSWTFSREGFHSVKWRRGKDYSLFGILYQECHSQDFNHLRDISGPTLLMILFWL